MKKITIIFTVFIFAMAFNSHAGYLKKGFTALSRADRIQNYTLTFDERGVSTSIGSMHTSAGPAQICNAIVATKDNAPYYWFVDIALGDEKEKEDFHIEVRDCQFVKDLEGYILCGTRGIGPRGPRAFVAFINMSFSSIIFHEFTDADILYSIIDLRYEKFLLYACGKSGPNGTILMIDPFNLNIVDKLITDIEWEYHKIIKKPYLEIDKKLYYNMLIVSGKDLSYKLSGFTVLDPYFSFNRNYYFKDETNTGSLCAVTDWMLMNDNPYNYRQIFLTTSLGRELNVFRYDFGLSNIIYKHTFGNGVRERLYIQDISANMEGYISVAGFADDGEAGAANQYAYYGEIPSLYGGAPIYNNYFTEMIQNRHYKVKHHPANIIAFTGGEFRTNKSEVGFLFADPQYRSECDYRMEDKCNEDKFELREFKLNRNEFKNRKVYAFEVKEDKFPIEINCNYREGKPLVPQQLKKDGIEEEYDIQVITQSDYIILDGLSTNIPYQVYAIDGRLLLTGTTNSRISIGNLPRGIYILKLENGNKYKFVR